LLKRFVAEPGTVVVTALMSRETYIRLDLDDDVLMLGRDLIRRHPLRGFDAIHLASASALRTMLAEDFAFAAADTRLLEAARAERFRALNVERIHMR
jgi:hypothetical protein